MRKIGVFPASGALGGSTYTHLLKLVPHDRVILINRHPEKVPQSYVDSGVTVRQASYESAPSELQVVFSGVEVLFLVSYPSHVHEYRVKVQIPAIDAARKAGVKHVFYSSLAFAGGADSDSSAAVVMQAHLDSERHLHKIAQEDSTFTYTSIREGIYSESFPIYTAFFNPKELASKILIPHDGTGPGIAWTKRDELGEGSAKLIATYTENPDSFRYINAKVLLTGPREWSLRDTVKLLGEVIGADMAIAQVSVDEYAEQPQVLGRFGTEDKAKTWATAWAAIKDGATAVVTPDLENILGRKPEEFDVTIRKLLS